MDNEIIDGGCILLSRQILNSDIWKKPPEYLKIFLYILLRVNHKNELYPRGSNFFNFSDQKPDGVTLNQIYKFLSWARSEKVQILATRKSTRGVVIKVNNYDRYQTLDNYYRQDTRQNDGRTVAGQRQDSGRTINKNERMKELNNVISIVGENKPKQKKEKTFTPPTLEEIKQYCIERNNGVDPQRFYDYYNAGDWKDSKGKPLKNWKQKMIAVWEEKEKGRSSPTANNPQTISTSESFYMSLSK